ncbi:MAG: hypothetical protein GDA47_01650 [Rhodospirillales bacterium]|nr:hypothetical protein [Rhodospirillales bacterium]
MNSGETEAIVIIKAAPQTSQKHGETVCCAAIDLQGKWLRLYPISFRSLEEGQKFGRWDRVRFKWRMPADDARVESRRVDQASLEIVGKLKKAERQQFLSRSIVTSLDKELDEKRSLALLKAEITGFKAEPKSNDDIKEEAARFDALRNQKDLFNTEPIIPHKACPYRFKYRYRSDDGKREGTCQDWETETTYHRWERKYGREHTLAKMEKVFGEEYPSKGMLLAMGTHSRHLKTWSINGVV